MTKHIEEARELEPVAYIVPEALQELEKHSAASATVWSGKATHRFVKDACPLVRLSDAQAALAAAEERGRSEERERCANIAQAVASGRRSQQVDAIIRGSKREAKDFESMKFCAIEIASAITKEPTP